MSHDIPESVSSSAVRQVEYYLSNDNLATDTFLSQMMDENGWVDLKVLVGFAKMQALCPRGAEATWVDTVCRVLAERSEKLVLDVPNLKVKRREANLPDFGGRKPKNLEIVTGQNDRTPEKSIFVGNLSDNVNEVILYELFAQVGPVDRVSIPLNDDGRLKGFAFVQFADGPVNAAEHSVSYAIKVMYDVELFGRRLHVKRRNTGSSADRPRSPRRVVKVGELVDLD